MKYFLRYQILRPKPGVSDEAKASRTARFDKPFLVLYTNADMEYGNISDSEMRSMLFRQGCINMPPLDSVDFQDFFTAPQNMTEYCGETDGTTVIIYLEIL